MTSLYVRHTDGSNSDGGTTWPLAKATIDGASAIDSAGDSIYLSHVHAESQAAVITCNWAGTIGSPVRVMCGNDGAEPPTAVATTATVTATGNGNNITHNGFVYGYGITFSAGNSTNAANIQLGTSASQMQVWEQCGFTLAGTGSTSTINVATGNFSVIEWRNCNVTFAASGHKITVGNASSAGAKFHWHGGTVSGTSPTLIFSLPGISEALVEGVDFSAWSSGVKFVDALIGKLIVRNCKLPSGWSFPTSSGTIILEGRFELWNCDNGATNYAMWIEDYHGTIKHETTLIRSGGATADGTGISWKMVTNSNNAGHTLRGLKSPEIYKRITPTGSPSSPVTATVEFLRDSATNSTNADLWLEIQYLSSSGSPLGSFVSSIVSDRLASTSATDCTTSSETWTTTGMSNPNKQKLSVTFTPQMAGYIIANVIVGKASATYYIDPELTLT